MIEKGSLKYIINSQSTDADQNFLYEIVQPSIPENLETTPTHPSPISSTAENALKLGQQQQNVNPRKRIFIPVKPPPKSSKKPKLPELPYTGDPIEKRAGTEETLKLKKKLAKKILSSGEIEDLVKDYGDIFFSIIPKDGNSFVRVDGGLLQLILHCLYDENEQEKIVNLRENLRKLENIKDLPDSEDIKSKLYDIEKKKYVEKFMNALCLRDHSPEALQLILSKVGKFRKKISGNNFLHLLMKKLFSVQIKSRSILYNNLIKIEQTEEGRVLAQEKNKNEKDCFQTFDNYFLAMLEKFFKKIKYPTAINKQFFDGQCFHAFVLKTTSDEFVKGDTILHFLLKKLFKSVDEKTFNKNLHNINVYIKQLSEQFKNGQLHNIGHKNSEDEDCITLFNNLYQQLNKLDKADFKIKHIKKLDELKNCLQQLDHKAKEDPIAASHRLMLSLNAFTPIAPKPLPSITPRPLQTQNITPQPQNIASTPIQNIELPKPRENFDPSLFSGKKSIFDVPKPNSSWRWSDVTQKRDASSMENARPFNNAQSTGMTMPGTF